MATVSSRPPVPNPGPAALAAPRSRATTKSNFELYGWLFMRVSGLLLVVLVLGHLWVNLVTGEGINQVSFAFVAGKWSSPFWQTWDLLMLWLAQLHGANGLRTIINDYAERDQTRFWLKVILLTASVVVIVLGTLTILTFDPCIEGSTYEFCPGN
jgi:succinate dehydrogenase / fumarate reductase membrane anchor subunit